MPIRLFTVLTGLLVLINAKDCILRDFSHFAIVNFTGSVGSYEVSQKQFKDFDIYFSFCGDIRSRLPAICGIQERVRLNGRERTEVDLPLLSILNRTSNKCDSYYRNDMVYTTSTGIRGAEFYFEPRNISEKFILLQVKKPNYAIGEYDGGTFFDSSSPDIMKIGAYLLDFEYSFLDYFKSDLQGKESWVETTFNVIWVASLSVVFICFGESKEIKGLKIFQIAVNWAGIYLILFSFLEISKMIDSTIINSLIMYLSSLFLSIMDVILGYRIYKLMKSRMISIKGFSRL